MADVTLRDAEALVGLPWDADAFDCMHLVLRTQRELFGRVIDLHLARHPHGRAGQAAAVRRWRDALAVRLGTAPATGDAALFFGAGGNYHIGTVFVHEGQRWLLHMREGAASLLQREADALRCGLRLEGYYRWR